MPRGEGFWPEWENNKLFSVLVALVLVVLIVLIGAQVVRTVKEADRAGLADQVPQTISVSAIGNASAIPDIGRIELTVLAQGATSSAAQDAAATEANALLAKMRELGIAETDLKTSSYSVYPLYDYDVSPQQIRVYEASQSLTVTVRDLALSDRILEEAGNLSVDYIGGVQMEIDDPTAVQAEARKNAIAKARAQAEDIARAMGEELGDVVSYYEYEGGAHYPYERALDSSFSSMSPEIAEGENELEVNVAITYGIE